MFDIGTPEAVALKLFEAIRKAERKTFTSENTPGSKGNHSSVDRKWILSTYKECLLTVKLKERNAPPSLDYSVLDTVLDPNLYAERA